MGDWMPEKEKLPHRIDETVAGIATILARGFARFKRSGLFAADSASLKAI